jgi:hypothetical protein
MEWRFPGMPVCNKHEYWLAEWHAPKPPIHAASSYAQQKWPHAAALAAETVAPQPAICTGIALPLRWMRLRPAARLRFSPLPCHGLATGIDA